MDDEGLTPKKIEKLVESAVNPTVAYRREICRRLAKQIYNQFGLDGLFDLLTGIDEIGKLTSVVISERSEIENYVFEKHGVFDPDIFEKVQLSDEWDELLDELIQNAGQGVASIIDNVIAREND